ncbi:MAG: rod shape-determining protein MreD [Pseudomonadota bacterium]
MSEPARGYWVILASFFIALTLTAVPLPRALLWWRPEWTVLVLLYWVIALPHRVGLLNGLLLGLLLDVLKGALIGQSMLSIGVVVTLARLMYQRLRVFSLLQQAGVVFVLIGIHQLIGQWLQGLEGASVSRGAFLLPAISSAILWPALFTVLRAVRRTQGVS